MVPPTKKFAFILGREQEICLEELKSVFGRFCFYFDVYKITGNVVFAKLENFSSLDVAGLMDQLSGTIKIYELVGSLGNNISEQIVDAISKQKAGATNKINFGVSCFNKKLSVQQVGSFALTAKKKLKGKFSLRYVESRDGAELSSILTLKNNLLDKGIEIGLFDEEIGVLVAFNNPEEWNKRDYGKPASDKFSGMLPPKLARAMVNIALGQIGIMNKESRIMGDKTVANHDSKFMIHNSQRPTVVDPFCGSGSVLLEAMMVGCDVVGSDISEKAVADSEKNCSWLLKNYQLPTKNYQLFQADATSEEFRKILTTDNCELITSHKNLVFVTEPYLGEPKKFKQSFNAAKGEYDKVKELYVGFLNNLSSLVPHPSSLVLCLVFPLIETLDQGQFSLYKECVDEIKNLGYTQVRPTMIYGRDYQIVKRQVVLLKLT